MYQIDTAGEIANTSFFSIDDDENCGNSGETFNSASKVCQCGSGPSCVGNFHAPYCNPVDGECRCSLSLSSCTPPNTFCNLAANQCTLGTSPNFRFNLNYKS